LIRFFLILCVISFAIAISGIYMGHLHWIDSLPSFFYVTLTLLLVGTFAICAILYKSHQQEFVQLYLLTMVIKLIAYIIYNIIVVVLDKEGAFRNVAFFMFTYFLFTALEVGFLYWKVSR
jgi:hypothetical protein